MLHAQFIKDAAHAACTWYASCTSTLDRSRRLGAVALLILLLPINVGRYFGTGFYITYIWPSSNLLAFECSNHCGPCIYNITTTRTTTTKKKKIWPVFEHKGNVYVINKCHPSNEKHNKICMYAYTWLYLRACNIIFLSPVLRLSQ